MTQQDRDRLVVLRKTEKKLIGPGQAARELGVTARQIRRLLQRLKKDGDKAVIHKLRGRPSNRKTDGKTREKIVRVLSEEVYRDFGPTLASEYLADKHDIRIGREALRQVMISAGLWRARGQKVEAVHQWRERRSCRGELIQWDTSTHDWLEGRGETIYLIHMIDDATSELTARFVRHDSTEENMSVLRFYLERHGRPVAFYTDKASLFQTAVKRLVTRRWLATARSCHRRRSDAPCGNCRLSGSRRILRRPRAAWNGASRRPRTGWSKAYASRERQPSKRPIDTSTKSLCPGGISTWW